MAIVPEALITNCEPFIAEAPLLVPAWTKRHASPDEGCSDKRHGSNHRAILAGAVAKLVVNELLTAGEEMLLPVSWSLQIILNAIAEKPKRQSKDDFGGISRHG